MKDNENITTNNIQSEGEQLKRVLTTKYVVFFGLAYIVPTSIFTYYGIVTQVTKGMMPLGYIITTVVMLFTAISYGKMVSAFPLAGSAYTYVQKSMNPHLGFLVGWAMMLDYLLTPMLCFLVFGIYMNEFFPGVDTVVWVLLCAAIVAGINIIGITIAARVDMIITIFAFAFTIFFIILAVRCAINSGFQLVDAEAIYNSEFFNARMVLFGSSILACAFLGFDAVTTVAEETVNPEKTITRAIIIICAVAGFIFFVGAYVAQIIWPDAWKELSNPDAGVFELLGRIDADYMPTLFLIMDNIATVANAIAAQTAVTRLMYAMGRDGMLPKKIFGYIHPKTRTPIYNIIITTLIGLTAIFYADNLLGAASLISFGALVGFLFVNFSVIMHYFKNLKLRTGKYLFKYLIMPGLGTIMTVILVFTLDSAAKILGCIWVVIGLIYLVIKTKGFKELPPELSFDE